MNPSMKASSSKSHEEIESADSDVLSSSSSEESQSDSDDTTREQRSSDDLLRDAMEEWAESLRKSPFHSVPPVCMVMFPDLTGKCWGWKRMLPDVHSSVEWHHYKSYLLQYLEKNDSKVRTDLRDAVSRCIEAENRLIRDCHTLLSYEELCLINDIKVLARDLAESDGKYPAAATALLAITTEAELMCEMKIHHYCTSEVRDVARQLRQAAYNLIRCEGSESEAVIAAMVGLSEDSKIILEELREGHSPDVIHHENVRIRQGIAKVLAKLGQELACKGGNAGTLSGATKKLMGDSEDGNEKTSDVVEDSGHALKNNETGPNAVPN